MRQPGRFVYSLSGRVGVIMKKDRRRDGGSTKWQGDERMTLEVRLKQAALKTAVTITLGGLEKAPERCARTLMELGRAAFPERVKAEEEPSALRRLLKACRELDAPAVWRVFVEIYL